MLLASVPLMAQESGAAEEKSAWSGETELGYSYESGNTNETKMNFRQKIVYDARPWLNTLTFRGKNSVTEVTVTDAAGNTSKEDQRTDEAYYVTEQLDHFIANSSSYLFLRGTWEKDRFNGYDHQSTAVFGYGNELVANDSVNLKLEIGVGGREDEFDEDLTDDNGDPQLTAGDTSHEGIVYLSDELVWKVSEPAEIGQALNVEYANDNTVSRFSVYVKSQLLSSVAMKVSYEIKHQDVVADNSEKTDKILLASLLYSF